MALLDLPVGGGDLHSYFEPECYSTIMNILNDPDNEWNEELEAATGYDRGEIISIMRGFEFDSEENVYYWPQAAPDPWDLMGEYGGLAEVFEEIGWSEDVDCGLGTITITNSHQGVGGM